MGMTLTEKILAKHAGRDRVRPGDFIVARVDLVLGNDITAPVAIAEFERIGATRVFDPDKIALVPDHFTPNKDIKSAEQVRIMREFAKKHGITHFFEIGEMGIEHCLLPEKGMVVPGDLVVGADSHTCTYGALGAFSTGVGSTDIAAAMATGELWFRVPETIRFVFRGSLKPWVGGKDLILYTIGKIGVDGARYKAMEFAGEAISSLSVEGRLTMANMAIEAGGKNGIFMPDQKTVEYLLERTDREYELLESDADAEYSEVYEFDASEIEPQVALPHLPENARPVSEVKGIQIDQVVIGSYTNGRIEDLREAAAILRNKKSGQGCPLHHNPRHSKCILAGSARGTCRGVRRGGRCGQYTDVRAVPGRTYGSLGCWRESGFNDQQELRRQDGPSKERGLSGRASSRSGISSCRRDSWP